jgi:hypothetical protein
MADFRVGVVYHADMKTTARIAFKQVGGLGLTLHYITAAALRDVQGKYEASDNELEEA